MKTYGIIHISTGLFWGGTKSTNYNSKTDLWEKFLIIFYASNNSLYIMRSKKNGMKFAFNPKRGSGGVCEEVIHGVSNLTEFELVEIDNVE